VGLIERGLKEALASRPSLHIVRAEPDAIASPPLLNEVTWRSSLNEIKHMASAYRLTWMVNQATARVGKLKLLGDAELLALLAEMRIAAERMKRQPAIEEALIDDMSRNVVWR
jgi:hypothetical protein